MLIGGLLGFDPPTCLALAGARRVRDLLFYLPGLLAWQWAAGSAKRPRATQNPPLPIGESARPR